MTENNNEESKLDKLKEQLDKVKEERDKYLNGWKRARADLENYKKDEAERLDRMKQKSIEGVLSDILTVIDSFELSLLSDNDGTVEVEGVKIIKNQLDGILKRHGLKRIEVSPGDEFDPEVQEAVSRVESKKPEGTVVNIAKPGYLIDDKVIRPAQVEVSKGNDSSN